MAPVSGILFFLKDAICAVSIVIMLIPGIRKPIIFRQQMSFWIRLSDSEATGARKAELQSVAEKLYYRLIS